MKVRESLTDNGENGTVITYPDGLAFYPDNKIWGLGRVIGWVFLLFVFTTKKGL